MGDSETRSSDIGSLAGRASVCATICKSNERRAHDNASRARDTPPALSGYARTSPSSTACSVAANNGRTTAQNTTSPLFRTDETMFHSLSGGRGGIVMFEVETTTLEQLPIHTYLAITTRAVINVRFVTV